MNYDTTKIMILKLKSIIENLRYGSASVSVRIHDGRIVLVSYTSQEHTKENAKENKKDE